MARRADALIVCSYYMRGHVADIFDIEERRIAVIPNGIDPSELRPAGDLQALRAEVRSAAREARAVCRAAGLREGLSAGARRAAERARARCRTCAFWSPAAARTRRELQAQAERLGLTEHGSFLGWIGDDVLHSLYRIADLCVVPSIYEPFGLVALEAMASGCPCIVADTGGLREVVPVGERVGLRFNGGDAEHLGVMIERLLVDERAARTAGHGGLRARAALRLGRHRPAHARDLQRAARADGRARREYGGDERGSGWV